MRTIAVTHEGGIIIEDNLPTTVIAVIVVEIIKQFRDLPLVLHEEGLQYTELAILAHLATDQPVDVRVGIKGDDERQLSVEVAILTAVVGDGTVIERFEIKHILIRRSVEVDILPHAAVEAVRTYLNALAHDGRGEGQRRQVALGTADKLLTQEGKVLDTGVLLIEKAL